ncbi:MAG: NUDIX hydrolase [Candidatus Rokuibacteriota bacterium]|nr:MAG: NUDIX hydrolase [Candidatus Rokubacteria bacterium]
MPRRSGRPSRRPRRDGRGRTLKPTAVTSAPKFCIQCGSRLVAVREEGRTRRRCPRCGWTFYGNPVPAAVALVTRGGRLLLTRRARPPYAATWDLPGGFLEAGEHPEACLRRELREELGMRARQARFVDFALDRYGPKGFPLLTLVYRVMPGPGRLRPGDDVSEARWFRRRAIPYREIAFPGLRRLLRRWVSGR